MKTGRDVVVAALLGAEEFGFATAPLVVMGCVMMRRVSSEYMPRRHCNAGSRAAQAFTGDPENSSNYFRFVAEEVRELMAQLGFRTLERNGRPRRLH